MSSKLRVAAAAALATIVLSAPVRAEVDTPARQEIETIVRDYLLANPEVLEEAFQVLQDRRKKEEDDKRAATLQQSGDLIYNSAHQAVIGNPDGAITLVEFFDYNCGYCKRAMSDMNALLDANPDLRIVMKEFPILSEGSLEAARLSIAMKDIQPDRYIDFHRELMSRPGAANTAKALEIAGDLGLDAEALKVAAAGADITANIQEVHKLATDLGISGTPSYIIGKEVIPGALGYDVLQKKVEAMRQCGVTVC